MSIFLIFCVLAAAAWLLLSVSHRDSSDRPDASIAAYSRAMAALSPQHDDTVALRRSHRAPAPRTRSRPRTAPPAHRRPSSAPRVTTRR